MPHFLVYAKTKITHIIKFGGITVSNETSSNISEPDVKTFQGLILALQNFWASKGCVVLQPLDMEVGAGTFHPATFLRSIGPETWNAAYVPVSYTHLTLPTKA